jgi:hypothetical protein
MKKSIIITEQQYSNLMGKINEQEEQNPLFSKNYLPDEKVIEASYYLMDEKPNSYVIINPKERLKTQAIWADGSQDYDLSFDLVELPKSQVKIVGDLEESPKYKIFKIPYWLYKKEPKLEIKRIEGKKRATLSGKESLLKKIYELGILDAFESLGGDFRKIKSYVEKLNNPVLPQKVVNSDSKRNFEYKKPYWGD